MDIQDMLDIGGGSEYFLNFVVVLGFCNAVFYATDLTNFDLKKYPYAKRKSLSGTEIKKRIFDRQFTK